MQLFIDFLIQRLGKFVLWLNTLTIVPGVTLLGFFGAIIVITLLVHNLLHRAG